MTSWCESPLDLTVNQSKTHTEIYKPSWNACTNSSTNRYLYTRHHFATRYPNVGQMVNAVDSRVTQAPIKRKYRPAFEEESIVVNHFGTQESDSSGVVQKKRRTSQVDFRQDKLREMGTPVAHHNDDHRVENDNKGLLANMEAFLSEMQIFSLKVQEKLNKDDQERVLVLHKPVQNISEKELDRHIRFYSKWFQIHGLRSHCVFITECLFAYENSKCPARSKIHMLVAASSHTGLVFHKIQLGGFSRSYYSKFISTVCSKLLNYGQIHFIFENWPKTDLEYSLLKDKNIGITFLPTNQEYMSMLTPMKNFVLNRVQDILDHSKLPSNEDARRFVVPLNTLHHLLVCSYLDESLTFISPAAFSTWFRQLSNRFIVAGSNPMKFNL
ncbi:uncharacterized protein LOC117121386 [Anneissia japonica]|uniref:uncharacterized protein LOC117121386 n=1 Tax=Anneissia japonica TaxID=1529436 RepID=UPI0014255906|nr:uncharacterized protein LOC117121386 [Anneissia japonica]XP_033122471.1 uncharacterized protein LOC117121386 [Anneissia japonica]XP_033122472.1 uncharacterized protein LOC117121386 [Anneissia japonica]